MAILVTGAAGFIGFHVARALLDRGARVLGLDNLSPYYDPELKRARLARLTETEGFAFHRLDLSSREDVARFGREHRRSTASSTWRRRPACVTRSSIPSTTSMPT